MNDLIDNSRGRLSPVSLRREVAVRSALRDYAGVFIMLVFTVLVFAA